MVSPGFRKLWWIGWVTDHQTVTVTFFWCKFDSENCFGASSQSSHWAGLCWLLHKIHFSSHVIIQLKNSSLLLRRIREDNTSKQWLFFYLWSVHEAPTYWAFHLSNLLQLLNAHGMVDIEFFSNFPCICKRISFNDGHFRVRCQLQYETTKFNNANPQLFLHQPNSFYLHVIPFSISSYAVYVCSESWSESRRQHIIGSICFLIHLTTLFFNIYIYLFGCTKS